MSLVSFVPFNLGRTQGDCSICKKPNDSTQSLVAHVDTHFPEIFHVFHESCLKNQVVSGLERSFKHTCSLCGKKFDPNSVLSRVDKMGIQLLKLTKDLVQLEMRAAVAAVVGAAFAAITGSQMGSVTTGIRTALVVTGNTAAAVGAIPFAIKRLGVNFAATGMLRPSLIDLSSCIVGAGIGLAGLGLGGTVEKVTSAATAVIASIGFVFIKRETPRLLVNAGRDNLVMCNNVMPLLMASTLLGGGLLSSGAANAGIAGSITALTAGIATCAIETIARSRSPLRWKTMAMVLPSVALATGLVVEPEATLIGTVVGLVGFAKIFNALPAIRQASSLSH